MINKENVIVFPIFNNMTPLDFMGPYQVMQQIPGVKVIIASVNGEDIVADGITFSNLRRLNDLTECDVICIPGGFGVAEIINDEEYLRAVKRIALKSKYITSVCTGSLILGVLGLLKNKKATTHWASKKALQNLGAKVHEGRVIKDTIRDSEDNILQYIITGGGVTAGIDFALTLVAEIYGDQIAKMIQIGLEYTPSPPFFNNIEDDKSEIEKIKFNIVAHNFDVLNDMWLKTEKVFNKK